MTSIRQRSLLGLITSLLPALAACSSEHGTGADRIGQARAETSLGQILSNIVQNPAFTNLYVYPTPNTESWEAHIASLRSGDAASFSRVSIDAATDRMMDTTWPTYSDSLFQYHCGFSTDCGINPPQFFGSGVVRQSCVDAALADMDAAGALTWTTVRSLANCHLDGMDPSPQLNIIFSPDIPIAKVAFPATSTDPEMCSTSTTNAYHAWGVNTPNFAALPTRSTCSSTFGSFTQAMSHEVVEILTDPAGDGYADFPNYTAEAADLCQATSDSLTNVGPDALARYWSNSDNDCEPRLDAPGGSKSTTWVLGEGSPLKRFKDDALELALTVPSSRVTTDAQATQVIIVIQTGGDDLGDSHSADVTLSFNGGSTTTTGINQGHHWDNGQTHSVILALPGSPVKVSDISGVTIDTHGGGDNWNVDKVALVVSFASGSTLTVPPHPIIHPWLDASELPLVRFTGSVHDLHVPVPSVDLGVGVTALDLVISTGNDNLNGGGSAGDNCDVTLELASGPPITLTNVNHGGAFDGWSKHSVSIPVPAALKGGDITAVDLHTGFGGGDNWNVERVELRASIDPASLIHVTIVNPTATDYAHSASITLDYSATDDGGPGLASVVSTIDGATTVSGQALTNGHTVSLLTGLALGSHEFQVVATDVWGNMRSASVTFQIIVTADSIKDDITELAGSGDIAATQQRSLLAKLEAALAARMRGNCKAAGNIYEAFIHEVEAQTGGKIDAQAAAILIADAEYMIAHCP
jgi:hypothetical protein